MMLSGCRAASVVAAGMVPCLAACIAAGAHAQPGAAPATGKFPSKPIRIIVSSAPGGGQDITTRPVAQELSVNLGSSVIVDNRGGGLSYCHPGMNGLLVMIEAVRQMRGECGQRQVKDCEIAHAHGKGAVLSSECTVLFGRVSTV